MLGANLRCGFMFAVAAMLTAGAPAYAGEHVTLTTGFAMDCVSHEAVGDRIRCYSAPPVAGAERNYVDIASTAVLRVEEVADPSVAVAASVAVVASVAGVASVAAVAPVVKPEHSAGISGQPTVAELKQLLARAGAEHNIDAELLASVVHAESGGHAQAVSRTGARGLMQLMPATAQALGVKDAFVADQNVEGGTKYLDAMLTRYHDNIALALAAYNAGPGAVDRYRGVPPFRETRAYVASVIREFNRRKTALLAQAR